MAGIRATRTILVLDEVVPTPSYLR